MMVGDCGALSSGYARLRFRNRLPTTARGGSTSLSFFSASRPATTSIGEGSAAKRTSGSSSPSATRLARGTHFAPFPQALVERCLAAGCPEGGTVLDPFVGSGTTMAVALAKGRSAVGIELNEKFCELARDQLRRSPQATRLWSQQGVTTRNRA